MWMEIAVTNEASATDCMDRCQLHPEATAMQYKPGSCACLSIGDGLYFSDAITGINIDGDDTDCVICDLSTICHNDVCHNDGHWIEVAFPTATEISGCRRQCMLHDEATSFQYNDSGWCGCMVLAEDVVFADAIVGDNMHPEVSACTVCDLNTHRSKAPAPPPPVCQFAWNEDADESCIVETGGCGACYDCFMYDNSLWGGAGSGVANHQGLACGCIEAPETLAEWADHDMSWIHCGGGYFGCSGCSPACDHCVAPAPPPPNECKYAWGGSNHYSCVAPSEGGADARAMTAGRPGEDGANAEMEAHGYTGGICYELCYECWVHNNADWGGEGCGCFEDDDSGAACVSTYRISSLSAMSHRFLCAGVVARSSIMWSIQRFPTPADPTTE